MDAEIENFIKIWITAIASVSYCYYIVSKFPKGIFRFISLLPILYLFIILPLNLTSIHLSAITIFYLLWLGNFKLLLFAFDEKDPLSQSSSSLLHFISIALLPIKSKQNPSPKTDDRVKKPAFLALKALILAAIVYTYQFRDEIHPYVIWVLYGWNVYLAVELILFITAKPIQAILGLEIEPQFNEPYLSTSLQDFWGQRWNIMVTSILRPTVYIPVRSISTRIFGRRASTMVAMVATFLVSGLMHEVLYYYLSRVWPTWEVTWFFVIHGICTAIEVGVKKALNGKWRFPTAVSRLLTVGFVTVSGVWLFLPQIIRNGLDRRAIDEYSVMVNFVKGRVPYLLGLFGK